VGLRRERHPGGQVQPAEVERGLQATEPPGLIDGDLDRDGLSGGLSQLAEAPLLGRRRLSRGLGEVNDRVVVRGWVPMAVARRGLTDLADPVEPGQDRVEVEAGVE
jgi:hypothetical protein